MATIRAYTSLEQSRKLAEILPFESADQTWVRIAIAGANLDVPEELQYRHNVDMPFKFFSGIGVPCWSLAALLGVLPYGYSSILTKSFTGKDYYCKLDGEPIETTADNPVDACYEMIIKLHELNLL